MNVHRDGDKRKYPTASGILLFVVLTSITIAFCMSDDRKKVTLSEKDSGTTVLLNIGDELQVRLPVSMGTGYAWRLRNEGQKVLASQGNAEHETSPESKPGGSETEVFRFVARRKGRSSLELDLSRSWEKDTAPVKKYSVEVRVR